MTGPLVTIGLLPSASEAVSLFPQIQCSTIASLEQARRVPILL